MAHSSSGGHVGYIVWPQKVSSRKNPGMPSQYLMCPEVAISQRIHLWEGKNASSQPCESSNASPDSCGQEPWDSVALWVNADVVTVGTFPGHVCPNGNSRRLVPTFYRWKKLAVSFGLYNRPRLLDVAQASRLSPWDVLLWLLSYWQV